MSEPLEFLPHRWVVAHPRAPRPVAIAGILRVGDLVLITGSYDTFKSTLAMELAYSLATGRPWLGHPDFRVVQRIRMGLLQTEIDPGGYDERCKRFPPTDDLLVCSCLDFSFDRMEELTTTLDDTELGGLVIDPLGQVWPAQARNGEPFQENVKTHVSPIMRELKMLGRTVILVHHDPKPGAGGFQGRASGSAALLNDPDVRIFIDRTKPTDLSIHVTVRNRLQRPARPFYANFNEETGRLTVGRPAPAPTTLTLPPPQRSTIRRGKPQAGRIARSIRQEEQRERRT